MEGIFPRRIKAIETAVDTKIEGTIRMDVLRVVHGIKSVLAQVQSASKVAESGNKFRLN